jgi:hypothetical protein
MIYFGRGPQRIEAFSLLSMHTSYYHIIISECDVDRPLTDWGTTLLFKSATQRAITQCQDNSICLLKTDDSFAFWTCHSFCVCSTALLSLLTQSLTTIDSSARHTSSRSNIPSQSPIKLLQHFIRRVEIERTAHFANNIVLFSKHSSYAIHPTVILP